MFQYYNETDQERRAQGKKEHEAFEKGSMTKAIEIVLAMMREGLSDKLIARCTGISLEEVRDLALNKEYNYFFYNHQNPGFPAEAVKEAIRTHDYTTFKEIKAVWDKTEYVYLPDTCIESKSKIPVEIDEKVFMLIEHSEYECG